MTPKTDSRTLNKAIKDLVWLKLKTIGFSKFTPRTAWRFGRAIHVVNFQSFNSYNAEILGCTTESFSVNLGLHFGFMPLGMGKEYVGVDNPPKEWQCLFRKPLRRSLRQSNWADPRIWLIDTDRRNIDPCVNDVVKQIEHDALPWFAAFSDRMHALHVLETAEECWDQFGPSGTFGFGRLASPMRKSAISTLREAALDLE